MEKTKQKDTLLLIDANSLIHRAFHALPSFTTPGGKPSGALYGLASILIKTLSEKNPHYIAAAFDRPEPTFRKKEYDKYKATRAPTASDLILQLKEAHNLFNAFNIKTFEEPGWEADDIIATLANRFAGTDNLVVVALSGDLDILQIIKGDAVVVETPKKGISNATLYNEDAVVERFGVGPQKLADYKGLVGDVSDNIPGVPGVGPKTTEKLLKKHGSLEGIYKDAKEIGLSDDKLRIKLIKYEKQAILSKKLATLSVDAPIDTDLENLKIENSRTGNNLIDYIRELGFDSLIGRIENASTSRYNTNE